MRARTEITAAKSDEGGLSWESGFYVERTGTGPLTSLHVGDFNRVGKNDTRTRLRGMSSRVARALAAELVALADEVDAELSRER